MGKLLQKCDYVLVCTIRDYAQPLGRFALFIIFFWFGFLKIINASPANNLVEELLVKTMPFWDFRAFFIILGIFEMLVGLLFLMRGWERVAMVFLLPHMFTTFLPLVFLPHLTWSGFFIPTLEGQYIIKNLVIIALAFGIAAHLKPLKD